VFEINRLSISDIFISLKKTSFRKNIIFAASKPITNKKQKT
jgi:hypothetical protein